MPEPSFTVWCGCYSRFFVCCICDSNYLRLLVELTSIWVLLPRISLCFSLWIRLQCPFWRLHVIDPIFIVLDQLVYCFLHQHSGDWLTQFPSSRLDIPKCDVNFVGLVSSSLLVMAVDWQSCGRAKSLLLLCPTRSWCIGF
jgi:hypothetical protein